jgi:hypothetical protein
LYAYEIAINMSRIGHQNRMCQSHLGNSPGRLSINQQCCGLDKRRNIIIMSEPPIIIINR